MKHVVTLALCFLCLHGAALRAGAAVDGSGLTPAEKQREIALRNRLCANKNLSCAYVDSIFADPRLTFQPPAPPAPPPPPPAPNRTHERNPYLHRTLRPAHGGFDRALPLVYRRARIGL